MNVIFFMEERFAWTDTVAFWESSMDKRMYADQK